MRIGICGRIYQAVHAAKKAGLPAYFFFEQTGAHGRRDNNSHKDGQYHGRDYGQREFAVNGSWYAAKKGHGDKDG